MKDQLKPITPFNDYVAVIRDIDIPDGVELPQDTAEQMSNEGIVAGVGPDAGEDVYLGSKVIFRPNGRYLMLSPASGGYEGKSVIMVRKIDLIACIGDTDKYEFMDKQDEE